MLSPISYLGEGNGGHSIMAVVNNVRVCSESVAAKRGFTVSCCKAVRTFEISHDRNTL